MFPHFYRSLPAYIVFVILHIFRVRIALLCEVSRPPVKKKDTTPKRHPQTPKHTQHKVHPFQRAARTGFSEVIGSRFSLGLLIVSDTAKRGSLTTLFGCLPRNPQPAFRKKTSQVDGMTDQQGSSIVRNHSADEDSTVAGHLLVEFHARQDGSHPAGPRDTFENRSYKHLRAQCQI